MCLTCNAKEHHTHFAQIKENGVKRMKEERNKGGNLEGGKGEGGKWEGSKFPFAYYNSQNGLVEKGCWTVNKRVGGKVKGERVKGGRRKEEMH